MTPQCDAVLEELTLGPLSPGAQAHQRGCPHCSAVVAAYEATSGGETPAAPSAETLRKIRTVTREELSANPKVTPWRRQASWIVVAYLAIGIAGAIVTGIRWSQLRGTDALTLWSAGVVLLAMLTLGVFLGVAPGRRALLTLFVPVALIGCGLVIVGGTPLQSAKGFFAEGFPCMTTEVAMSLLPLAVAGWALLQSAFNFGRAVALGFAAAATGLVTLHLHCEQGMWLHVAVFHVFPAVAMVLLFAAVRRALPSRSYAP